MIVVFYDQKHFKQAKKTTKGMIYGFTRCKMIYVWNELGLGYYT